MRRWYWYVRQPNEIFCDLDSKRSLSRAFNVLRRSIRRKVLLIKNVYLYPSEKHFHLIAVLKFPVVPERGALWACWMGSDRLRTVYVLERLLRGVKAADVLSTRTIFKFRQPDDSCACPDKHKRKAITDHCPAMKRLMMDERSGDYFPRNFDRKERKPVKIPYGRVPKKLFR